MEVVDSLRYNHRNAAIQPATAFGLFAHSRGILHLYLKVHLQKMVQELFSHDFQTRLACFQRHLGDNSDTAVVFSAMKLI